MSKRLSRHAHRGVEAAAGARAALGLGLKLPVDDILALLERGTEMRIFVVRLGDDGIAGAYQWYDGSPWAIVNADNPVERQRFTLAHEYGHHFLEHSSVVDERIDLGTSDRQEVQASYFAGAFLALGAGHLLPEAHHQHRGGRPTLALAAFAGAALVLAVRQAVP